MRTNKINEKEIEQEFQLFRQLLKKEPNWKIPIKTNHQYILFSHVHQLLKLLTSVNIEDRQKVQNLFKTEKEIEVIEIADWIKKNQIRGKRIIDDEKQSIETFTALKWKPETILENKKWQKELKLLNSPSKNRWGPLELPHCSYNIETRENFVRSKFRQLLKLLNDQDPSTYPKIKSFFQKDKINQKELNQFLQLQPAKPLLKTPPKKKLSNKKIKKNQRTNYFLTFEFNLPNYNCFDGEKQLNFKHARYFLNYLVKIANKDKKNIILFGFNVLNLGTLILLIQEAISKGYYPTLAVKGKFLNKNDNDKSKIKFTTCYLKGDQIIIKDWTTFTNFGQKSKIEKEEELSKFKQDKNKLSNLYHQIQRLETKTQNKYQFSLLEKKTTSTIRIAWKDFWQTFEKEREQFGWEKIWSCSKQEDEFIRPNYRGGYLDLFQEQNYQGVVSDWDFKSFYPYIMAKYSFPISRPEWIDHPSIFYGDNWKETFYGYYQCKVECLPDNPYPFFNFRQKDEKGREGGWIYRPGKYPNSEYPKKPVLFSEEIKFFWKHTPKIKVEVQGGYFFREIKPIFHNWIRKLYKAKEKNDELAKIKMNSCYGMFGREKKHYKLEWSWIENDNSLAEFLSPLSKSGKKKKLYLNISQEEKPSWRFSNVIIASTITSYGRITLWKALLENWNNLLYCATDGFVLKGTENKFKSKAIFGHCGELEKKGEYEGFISLAPNSYAFKDKKGNLVKGITLKNLTDEQVNYLFNQVFTEENKAEIIKNAPNQDDEEWMKDLKRIIDDTLTREKKNLINGKWEIYK